MTKRKSTFPPNIEYKNHLYDDLTDPWYQHPILPHLIMFFVLLAMCLSLFALFR